MWMVLLHVLLVSGFTLRILLREDLAPDARMAWFMVIALFPLLGCAVYFLFGEVDIGHRVSRRYQQVYTTLHQAAAAAPGQEFLGQPHNVARLISPDYQAPFHYLASVNQLYPVAGNRAELMADADSARARLVADIDAATEQVNVLYYIWLNDHTGNHVAEALMRAARRGVVCRAMVDGLGSHALLKTPLWQQMRAAGVQTAVALPIRPLLRTLLTSRIDLRNHRKITVIDGKITYCGSQNCADAAFAVKAKYAPWVDIMLRLQGPVVTQTQLLFASDWMMATQQGLAQFALPTEAYADGFPAQVMGDGPTERSRVTPQLLVTLINSARQRLTISTPYFVPDATVLEALCAAAWRGVAVTLIFPRRNDSWVVAAASRSHYRRLLQAGVRIFEFKGGLLHAKTLTVDDTLTFIGSTNLDLRSFDLNYENNVLLQDAATTAAVHARQQDYIAAATAVTLAEVEAWSYGRRIWHNVLATVGPVL